MKYGIKTENKNKIAITGDRHHSLIDAIMSLPKEQREVLEKALYVELWDGHQFHIFEIPDKDKIYETSSNKKFEKTIEKGVENKLSRESLTENMKLWLYELYLTAAKDARGAASNSHIFALGSVGEEAILHEQAAEEARDYALILETMASELKCDITLDTKLANAVGRCEATNMGKSTEKEEKQDEPQLN